MLIKTWGRGRQVFQSRWGLPYLFWLKGAVCAEARTCVTSWSARGLQQEYLLPWEAFEKLAESTGFRPLWLQMQHYVTRIYVV